MATSFLVTQGNLVRTPLAVRERIPKSTLDVQPKVFKMLSAKSDIKDAQYLAASVSFTLPNIVESSPIVNLLTTVPDKSEWKYKYVPMLHTYAELGQLRVAINGGIFKEVPQAAIANAENTCIEEGRVLQSQFLDDIDTIIGDPAIGEREKITQFITRVEHFTIQTLNRIEKMIHTCIIGEAAIPLAQCLTPLSFPPYSVLQEFQKGDFWELFVNYWSTKVDITNVELKRDCDIEPLQWITVDGLANTINVVPPAELWRGYLTTRTASEYLNFFK